jgi:cyclopropane fatty-acyl-phospholipid synthase-like methyltransferase
MWYVDTSLSFDAPDSQAFLANARNIAEACLEHFDPDPARHVALDIGCGLGRVVEELSPKFRSVVGLDLSEEMLRRARDTASASNITLVLIDGVDLSCVRAESIDLAVSFAVFTHLPSSRWTRTYIREIARVLRPGGQTAFHVNSSSGSSWWAMRRGAKAIIGPVADRRRRWNRSFQGSAMSPSKLRRCVADAGLQMLEMRNPRTLFTMVYARKPAAGGDTDGRLTLSDP